MGIISMIMEWKKKFWCDGFLANFWKQEPLMSDHHEEEKVWKVFFFLNRPLKFHSSFFKNASSVWGVTEHRQMHTHTHTLSHALAHAHSHTHSHAHTRTLTHSHMHTHTHSHTPHSFIHWSKAEQKTVWNSGDKLTRNLIHLACYLSFVRLWYNVDLFGCCQYSPSSYFWLILD